MELSSEIARFVCGRWTKWIVLVAWLALAMIAGPLAAKLSGIQKNDAAEWLPSSAESTEVFHLQKTFQTRDVSLAIIIYERVAGTTADDDARARADAAKLTTVDGVDDQVFGPLPSEDGQALQLFVPVTMGNDGWNKSGARVDAMRTIVGDGGAGLTILITGPVGVAADQANAFAGTNTTLLFAAILVVIVILLLAYRSPVLWILPLMCAGLALTAAQAVIYLVADGTGMTVNGQGAAVLTVLVFGAGTDYALLLIARYREELRRHADRHEAMAVALLRAGPAILASAATVVIAMLCLLFADMNSTKGLGPVVAIGITVGLFAMLTLLPALLTIFGRWMFWPAKPKVGSAEPGADGRWSRLGRAVAQRPRAIWITTALVLGTLALGLTQLNANGLALEDSFVNRPDSVAGQEVLSKHYDPGLGQPVVVIGNAAAGAQLQQALSGIDGVTKVVPPLVKGDLVELQATLTDQPDSDAARATIERVRAAVHAVPGADAKVGGVTAIGVDLGRANSHDNWLIIPLVLLVVLLVLGVLLRAVVAPLVLIATVVLSFGAALGTSALVFEYLFGFNGADYAFPLFVFVWLIALGIDYNIFLMTRVREEAHRHGTRRGALIALTATGGVITAAGLVLAGTFAVLTTLPLVLFAELGFAVAFGILLDTFIVRSVLVTALNLDLGGKMWWPSKLAAQQDVPDIDSDQDEKLTLVR